MNKKTLFVIGLAVAMAASMCACGKDKKVADNEVMVEDRVVEVSEKGLKEAAQGLDGQNEVEADASNAGSISLDDCRVWTLFDDFTPVTSNYCDELRFSFTFPNAASSIGDGKLKLEGAYPTESISVKFEQTAHSSRYTEVIYEKDNNRITKNTIDVGGYNYFIEPGFENWMNVDLYVTGDKKDDKYLSFEKEFVAAFEQSLIDNFEGNTQKQVLTDNQADTSSTGGPAIVFTDMIGEYTASNGTKLWIATPFGEYDYAKGPYTVEIIKEHDISFLDDGAEINGNKATCYTADGQKVYITKTGDGTLTLELYNGDTLDYKVTNPGYNYNDF